MRQKTPFSRKVTTDYQTVSRGRKGVACPAPATKSALSANNSNSYDLEADFCRDSNETSFFQSQERPKEKKMLSAQNPTALPANIKAYTHPTLSTGKSYWYISFYAFDPASGRMRRKRVRISPKFKKVSERRQYANDLLERISQELRYGWNPWVQFTSPEQYSTWQDICDAYRSYIGKCKADNIVREKTWKGYISFLDNLNKWNDSQPKPIAYAFQCDQKFLNRFVDWLWLDKGLAVKTRDNYVMWLHTFGKYLVGHSFVEQDPTVSLQCLGSKFSSKKNRTIIPADQMLRLKGWCENNNRHFLLACYVLYYCFIRPNEMSYIQIKHISVAKGTVFVPDYSSKNRKDGTVTVPDVVVKLMIDLDVFSHPGDDYLFSKSLLPGPEHHSSKQFTDFWSTYVRKALKFPAEYKFYSLKDTGITDMIKDRTDLLSVRNQARHHSLLMTDIYTPHDIEEANDVIKNRRSYF